MHVPDSADRPRAEAVWFFAEHKDGKLEDFSHLIAGESRIVADKLGQRACAVIVGSGTKEFANAFKTQGIDEAIIVDSPPLKEVESSAYIDVLEQLAHLGSPSVILFATSPSGNELAPRLAARLKVGLVSRYIEFEVDREGKLIVHRPIHGGKARATIAPLVHPVVATIDPQILSPYKARQPMDAEISEPLVRINQKRSKTRIVDYLRADPCAVCVSEAEIVIGVGKGLQCADNLKPVEELAQLLGASIGASRRATDERWVADERRIGLTGKTITPRLYLICGISGAFHHTLGIKGSKLMVCINKDRTAPITKMADLVVIGDMHEVIPEMVNQLKDQGQLRD